MNWMNNAESRPTTANPSARMRKNQDAARTREQLIRASARAVFATCSRILGCEVAAQEATRAAFERAFECQEHDGDMNTLRRFAIESAVARANLTVCREEIEALLPSFEEDGHRRHSGDLTSIHSRQGQAELRALTEEKLQRLPCSHRIPLLLVDVEGMEPGRAAELLGLPRAELRSRLREARLALHELVESARS